MGDFACTGQPSTVAGSGLTSGSYRVTETVKLGAHVQVAIEGSSDALRGVRVAVGPPARSLCRHVDVHEPLFRAVGAGGYGGVHQRLARRDRVRRRQHGNAQGQFHTARGTRRPEAVLCQGRVRRRMTRLAPLRGWRPGHAPGLLVFAAAQEAPARPNLEFSTRRSALTAQRGAIPDVPAHARAYQTAAAAEMTALQCFCE